MNADYAHLLDRPIAIDWALFARALRCEMRKRGMTQTQVEKEARLSRATCHLRPPPSAQRRQPQSNISVN